MTERKSHNNKDYVCVDKDAEPLDNDSTDKNGALFYAVRTTCGSLRCPPYKNHTEMMCVVCTILIKQFFFYFIRQQRIKI